MATLTERVETLEKQVEAISSSMKQVLAGLEVIQRLAPVLSEEGSKAFLALAEELYKVATEGIRTPRLEILNKTGEPVVILDADVDGHGVIAMRSADGHVIGGIGADPQGAGILAVNDPNGRMAATLQAGDGAGRLMLLRPNTGQVMSFTPSSDDDERESGGRSGR